MCFHAKIDLPPSLSVVPETTTAVYLKKMLRTMLLIVLGLFCVGARARASVTLGWDPVTTSPVAGYRLYQGTVSEGYTTNFDVGNMAQRTVSGLSNGVTYYFAVTSYSTNGLESDFSGEIAFTPSVGTNAPLVLHLAVLPGRVMRLTGTGTAGHAYDVLATQNFKTWTVLTNITMNSQGSFAMTDLAAASLPTRSYRLRGTLP